MTTAALTIRVALVGMDRELEDLGRTIRSTEYGGDALRAVADWLNSANSGQELTPAVDGWRAVSMYASHPQWPDRCDGNIVLDILEWEDQTPRRKATVPVPQLAEDQPEETADDSEPTE